MANALRTHPGAPRLQHAQMQEINCVWMESVGQNVLDMMDVDRRSILIFAAITSVLPINQPVLNAERIQPTLRHVGMAHVRVSK